MILGLSTRTNFCYSHVHNRVWPTLKVAKSINKMYNSYRQQAFSLLITVKQYSFHLQVSLPFWKQILQSTSCLAIDYSTNSKRSTNMTFLGPILTYQLFMGLQPIPTFPQFLNLVFCFIIEKIMYSCLTFFWKT